MRQNCAVNSIARSWEVRPCFLNFQGKVEPNGLIQSLIGKTCIILRGTSDDISTHA
jgi:hypothetical protein